MSDLNRVASPLDLSAIRNALTMGGLPFGDSERLLSECERLRAENAALRAQLSLLGVAVPDSIGLRRVSRHAEQGTRTVAEASEDSASREYLLERGWWLSSSGVLWVDPNGSVHSPLTLAEAVQVQREREAPADPAGGFCTCPQKSAPRRVGVEQFCMDCGRRIRET